MTTAYIGSDQCKFVVLQVTFVYIERLLNLLPVLIHLETLPDRCPTSRKFTSPIVAYKLPTEHTVGLNSLPKSIAAAALIVFDRLA